MKDKRQKAKGKSRKNKGILAQRLSGSMAHRHKGVRVRWC